MYVWPIFKLCLNFYIFRVICGEKGTKQTIIGLVYQILCCGLLQKPYNYYIFCLTLQSVKHILLSFFVKSVINLEILPFPLLVSKYALNIYWTSHKNMGPAHRAWDGAPETVTLGEYNFVIYQGDGGYPNVCLMLFLILLYPYRHTNNVGPSGVRALPLAAGINVGGHYTWHYFSSLSESLTFLPERRQLGF